MRQGTHVAAATGGSDEARIASATRLHALAPLQEEAPTGVAPHLGASSPHRYGNIQWLVSLTAQKAPNQEARARRQSLWPG